MPLRVSTLSGTKGYCLHIGLNLLFIIPGHNGGTQVYSESLIRALAEADPEDQFTVYVSREGAALPLPDAPNFRKVVCPIFAVKRMARYLWEQFILPLQLRRHRIDLLHSLGYVGPLFPPCPQVVTVHDVNFLAIPSEMGAMRQGVLNKLVPLVAHRCARVLTVSQFSKNQIHEFLHVPESDIIVTHEGPREHAELSKNDWESISSQYGITGPYLIAFDSLIGHKNIGRLLQAFAVIQAQVTHNLLLIGHRPPGTDPEIEIARLGLTGRVHATGYVPDDHVMPLLGHADLFVFPSLYEGFGLPLLEAQNAGVAVACSTAASIPEVAGDGAAYFNPLSVEDMQRVLLDCLSDSALRADLIQKGRMNADRFSWKNTAAGTLACYRAVQAEFGIN